MLIKQQRSRARLPGGGGVRGGKQGRISRGRRGINLLSESQGLKGIIMRCSLCYKHDKIMLII